MADQYIKTSFAGGELSPNLWARVDLDKYQTGAEKLTNWFVDFRGGASNRPGTEYLTFAKVNTGVRLLPFVAGEGASYLLEFGHLYCRVYQYGVLVTELVTVYETADLSKMRYTQSADVFTITVGGKPQYSIKRIAGVFSIVPEVIGPTLSPPLSLNGLSTVIGTLAYCYCVTAITELGEESIAYVPIIVLSEPLDPNATTPVTIGLTWARVADAQAYNIYKAGPVPNGESLPTLFGFIGQTKGLGFTDNNIAADYSRTPPTYRDPFSPGRLVNLEITAGGAGYSGYIPLTIVGDGTGAIGYGAAKGGALESVVLLSSGKGYSVATVTAGGGGATITAYIDPNSYYPSAVTYFQQRRVYGGAPLAPETLEMSQIGAYSNFDISPSVLDTDAISVSVASRQVNTIKHFVPMATGLVAFTSNDAMLITGGGVGDPVTPTNVNVLPQAATGASDLQPIVINYNIIFEPEKGTAVRDMAFNWSHQTYFGLDRSMLSNHLFFDKRLVSWDWAEDPYKLLWVIRNDGRALTMAYLPDQEVYGWSPHETAGQFESVCVLQEGGTDRVYFAVRRLINGVWTTCIERLAIRDVSSAKNAWFLDCAVLNPRTAGSTEISLTASGDQIQVAGLAYVPLVGEQIEIGKGVLQITGPGSSGGTYLADIVLPIDHLQIPYSTGYLPIPAGDWNRVTPASSISVPHLAGHTVNVLGDGMVLGQRVVPPGGLITVSQPYTRLLVGLPYNSDLRTLNMDDIAQSTVQNKRKIIPAITLRLADSRGLSAGPDFNHLQELRDTLVPYGTPQDLYTGDIRQTVPTNWSTGGQICIRQSYPLPATVLGIVPEVLLGDNMR